MIKFLESKIIPNPKECNYWIDLNENVHGGSIKYFNGVGWVKISDETGDLTQIKKYVE